MTVHTPYTRQPLMRRVLVVVLASLLALGVVAPATRCAEAAGTPAHTERLATPADGVRVDTGPLSVPANGAFRFGVGVDVEEPTSYLEVRLQIHRPSGRLLFQRTEVRSDVPTGTVQVEFARDLGDLGLRPDAYPYTLRVRAQGAEVTERKATGFLLVHAPEPEITPVLLGARISSAPRFDPEGRFVTDPARSTAALEAAEVLARAVLEDRALTLALAISPVTLDEWARVAHGYTLAEGDGGLTEIGPDEPGPKRYQAGIDALKAAVATGRLLLLDVGYADPDPVVLSELGRDHDLAAHFARGLSAYLATLETSPSVTAAVAHDALPVSALDVLAERGVASVVLSPEALGGEEPLAGGAYAIDGSPVVALVLDPKIAEALAQGDTSAGALGLFRHAISAQATSPIVTLADLGPGRSASAQDVLDFAGYLAKAPWAKLTTVSELRPEHDSGPIALPTSLESTPSAPAGYWEGAADARRYAGGLEAAAGPSDPDARAAVDGSLIAQSARWAGPDNSWSAADRGRAFASYAERVSRAVLDQVSIAAKDVTLAGPKGEVPISVFNGSDKDLEVTLVMKGQNVALPGDGRETLTLAPQENFHTVRVDLGTALSGTLVVEARAGEVLLAEGTSVVRASYLDRLVIIGAVALLLLGLLIFIRRRVGPTDAGTMPEGDTLVSRKDTHR